MSSSPIFYIGPKVRQQLLRALEAILLLLVADVPMVALSCFVVVYFSGLQSREGASQEP